MASVLNPVQHARIWYKEAMSLSTAGWQVYVLGSGRGSVQQEGYPNLQGKGYNTAGILRLRMQWILLLHILKIRPDVLHIHTPELAIPALLMKGLLGYRCVYDRHEAYPVQLQDTQTYGSFARFFAPGIAKLLEKWLFKYCDLVLIAEEGYRIEAGAQSVLIRNSFLPLEVAPSPYDKRSYWIIGGTLGQRYGTQEALKLWESLYAEQGKPLVIAGICHEPELIQIIRALKAQYPDTLHLYGMDSYVPYPVMQGLMQDAYGSLQLFPDAAWLQGKVPTRFYESMGHGIKIVYSGIAEWDAVLSVYPCAIRFTGSVPELLTALQATADCHIDEEMYSWSEDARVLKAVYAQWASGY